MDECTLISINVERNKHWETVLPFLNTEKPDVLCVQELFESDIPKIPYAYHSFAPNSHWRRDDGQLETVGIAVFSNTPFSGVTHPYYFGDPSHLPTFDPTSPETIRATWWRPVVIATLENGFKVATTHFTWTPHGEWEPYQEDDLHALIEILKNEGEFVLCGDFNVPRGKNAIYDELVTYLDDDMPKTYAGSMDMQFHRTRGTPEAGHVATNMVDYLLSTKQYAAKNVRLQSGVSDHMAIVATITRS